MSEPEQSRLPQALIQKLSAAVGLTVRDQDVLMRMCAPTRRVEAGEDIIRQGDPPNDIHLVIAGFAHRYKLLADGSRQIVAVMLPSDFCDLHVAILSKMDHSIAALTACTIMDIPHATILDLMDNHPFITRALWWATLADEGTLREWITNLGAATGGRAVSTSLL